MSEKELRELDTWIAEHVMEWIKALKMSQIEKAGQFTIQGEEIYIHYRGNYVKTFRPTTDPAAAMMVLEKCLQKWWVHFENRKIDENYVVCDGYQFQAEAETLTLAICLFAKQLFSK